MQPLKPFEKILLESKNILVIGLSRNPEKESFKVASYLQEQDYNIIGVNPFGEEILGKKAYKSIAEVREPVDIVDVFRPSEECGKIAEEAVKLRPKMVWLQLGIENQKAREICQKQGVVFVQNKCTKTEHRRLAGI